MRVKTVESQGDLPQNDGDSSFFELKQETAEQLGSAPRAESALNQRKNPPLHNPDDNELNDLQQSSQDFSEYQDTISVPSPNIQLNQQR